MRPIVFNTTRRVIQFRELSIGSFLDLIDTPNQFIDGAYLKAYNDQLVFDFPVKIVDSLPEPGNQGDFAILNGELYINI